MPTSEDGRIFLQAKASLDFASKLDSEMGKTALEIVHNWRICHCLPSSLLIENASGQQRPRSV
jgi:hypothetical protein